jgi:ferredoxin
MTNLTAENRASYRKLAQRLDALPHGFPPTEDGVELRLLAKLMTPEEAELVAQLRLTPESHRTLAKRLDSDPRALRQQLKALVRRGLITVGRAERGLGYRLLPFVVGIYEMQAATIDAELAELFERYYRQAFQQALTWQPSVHRVVPIHESVDVSLEIRPYEDVVTILKDAAAWGVTDCICRRQQELIGQPCEHPVDVCMVLGDRPGAFDRQDGVRALTRDEAKATLRRAADAGLVHSVSNTRRGLWYICNCCTCACGILRGIAEVGVERAIARAPFRSHVDAEACVGCGLCVERCPFGAVTVDGAAQIDSARCTGCGLCVAACPQDALSLVRRADVAPPPAEEQDWMQDRAAARGQSLEEVL